MKKYITEFIGTFFLVLTVGLTVLNGAGGMANLAPVAIGVVLMVMVFAGGHISGAHYNPAVTLAVWIRGKISFSDAIVYWIVQLIAGAIAALVVTYLLGADKLPPQAMAVANSGKALLAEFLGTFALAYVVLNVATAKATANNSFYGLAIGFTVTAMAYALGGISGGAFNPAVAVGISMLKMVTWSNIWIYLVGCSCGAALAAFVFDMNNPDDK
jgi:aquaporin Z